MQDESTKYFYSENHCRVENRGEMIEERREKNNVGSLEKTHFNSENTSIYARTHTHSLSLSLSPEMSRRGGP